MEWLRQLPWSAALLVLLSTIFLIQSQVQCLQIRPQQCHNALGDLGTCMFVWECIKTEGTHLGTCADGFLFGSCCAHNDSKNDIFPSVESITSTEVHKKPASSTTTTSSTPLTFYSPSTQIYSTTARPQNFFTASSISYHTKPYPRPPYSKPSSTTSRPVFIRPTFKSSSTTSKPIFIRPTSKPKSTTIKPSYTRPPFKPSSSISKPIFIRPTSKPSSTPKPVFIRPTPKPSSTPKPVFIRPTPKPVFIKPTSKPSTPKPVFIKPTSKTSTTFKPSTTFRPIFTRSTYKPSSTTFRPIFTRPTSKPVFIRPTAKPSSVVTSTTIVYQPEQLESNSNSGSFTSVTKTTENPFIKSTTNKYGSSANSWIYATSNQPSYVSIKQPNFSTKSSTYRPTVTHWTSNYSYFRPSWKPTSKPTFVNSTTSNPFIYTYSTNNYTSRPSFTPFTNKISPPTFPSPPISQLTTMNITSHVFNITTPIYKPPSSTASTTWRPITKPTESAFSFIMAHFTRSTPSPSFTKTSSGYHQTSSPHSWLYPSTHTTTMAPSPTTSHATSQENIFWDDVSIQETTTTPAPQQSLETSSTVNVMTNYSSETIDSVNSTETKSTTPLPVQPCGMPIPHPQKKVVGGKNSAFGSWPWQASVRRTSFFGFSSTHRCGGALISRQWVATAGHCVDDLLLSQIKIRVGEYDFASVQEPHGYVERGVTKKVVHPRYNFFTYENDLALVQLEEAIDPIKHPHISPICLPPNEENLVGRNATVTGWGRLSEGGVLPSILQEVQVPIISNEKCKNMFLAAGRHEYIPDIFMCAGFEEGGRDSCQGDSGGPLQIQADEGYWFLAGIISWGIGCAEPNMPGVCTRISKFKDWVVQQIT